MSNEQDGSFKRLTEWAKTMKQRQHNREVLRPLVAGLLQDMTEDERKNPWNTVAQLLNDSEEGMLHRTKPWTATAVARMYIPMRVRPKNERMHDKLKATVRKMKQLRGQGLSWDQVAKKLNHDKVPFYRRGVESGEKWEGKRAADFYSHHDGPKVKVQNGKKPKEEAQYSTDIKPNLYVKPRSKPAVEYQDRSCSFSIQDQATDISSELICNDGIVTVSIKYVGDASSDLSAEVMRFREHLRVAPL